jgi:hypothetical protein
MLQPPDQAAAVTRRLSPQRRISMNITREALYDLRERARAIERDDTEEAREALNAAHRRNPNSGTWAPRQADGAGIYFEHTEHDGTISRLTEAWKAAQKRAQRKAARLIERELRDTVYRVENTRTVAGSFPTFRVAGHADLTFLTDSRNDRAGMRSVEIRRDGQQIDSVYIEPSSLWECALEGLIALVERALIAT